ncbi:MAG: HEAT repeat domain-containing protein, partial [Verrucomicrobia bacterium]|nr:HEAT repeat domain-containing protein [Verrucomicrobiota bacterium]
MSCGLGLAVLSAPLGAAETATKQAAPAKITADTVTKEVELQKWSGPINVPDPVSVAVDPQGRVYVTATTRRKVGDLDIREHMMWVPNDVAMTSVEEKSAFLKEALAPGKLRQPRGALKDHNGDGSIDWKDLTFHTERIYQLRDTDGDGVADKMTVFAEGFNTEVTGIAAGVMYHDGWVYATIAPDLWRFKDTDDDGVADISEIVVHGFGIHLAYAGHDMHGLSVGPDGRIYWSIGDKGANVTSREGKKFFYPNEGCVMRVEPDGSGFEIYAHGLRNPQEPAFDDYGDLFAVDNDADQRGERERFVRIVEQSDSGWRCNFQYMAMDSPWMREGIWRPKFDGQAAYHLAALSSYSDGPAGFRFEPGTALSPGQRGIFILNEFPSGKMRGFRAERDGSTFRMTDARVLNSGIMGIGLAWHPDGSLFLADWIGGYPLDGLGAVWRVDAPGAAARPERIETHRLLKTGFAKSPETELVALLRYPDQRVRQGAQLELAKRTRAAELLAVAKDATAPQLARIHGLWGYGQLLRRGAAPAGAVIALLGDADSEIRAQTAKILGDAPGAAKEFDDKLIPLVADAEPRVRLQAALALGKLAVPSAVKALVALAEKDGTESVLRHAAVTGLAGCATSAQLAALKTHASLSVRLAAIIALRRQAAPEASQFLADASPAVVEEAARAIHDDLAIPAALPALSKVLDTPGERSDVIARRAINANLRLGTPEAAGRLLTIALDAQRSREMRQEALVSLRVWNEPPPLDRVDGRARKFAPQPVREVLEARLDALLALTDPALKTLAIEIMIAHTLKAAAPQIAAIVADAQAAGALRAQALRLLAGQHRGHPVFASTLDGALAAESPAPLHMAALELLLPDRAEKLATEAQATLAGRSVPEKQHALAQLARAAHPAADAILDREAASLLAGQCPPALQLDVIEAVSARAAANPALAARAKGFAALTGTTHPELLEGGSSAAGQTVVTNHLNANCLACHSITPGGSEVGPNLRTVGAQNPRAYLL